jgi:hypothetical protein
LIQLLTSGILTLDITMAGLDFYEKNAVALNPEFQNYNIFRSILLRIEGEDVGAGDTYAHSHIKTQERLHLMVKR